MTTESVATLIGHLESFSDLLKIYQKDNSDDALDSVAQKLEETGLYAGEQNMPGLQDVCFLLQDFLLETPKGSVYKATQQQQLIEWVDTAKSYIQQPDETHADKLINIFRVECWPAPLTETDTSFMKDMLIIAAVTDQNNNVGKQTSTGDQTTIEDCFSRLEQILADENINNTDSLPELSEAINDFAQSTNEILSIGFQDVCFLLNENIQELIEQKQGLNDTQKALLIAWLGLAGKYIHDSGNSDLAKSLLLNLEEQHWPFPLAHEDAVMIAEMMGVQNFAEATTVSDIPENIAGDSSEIDLLNNLKQALDNYTSADSGALKNIVDQLENVGVFATESGLLAFQDVCLLIQQNIEDISAVNHTLSDTQLQALQQWTVSASKYIASPIDKSHVTALIDLLTEEHWPTPLTEVDTTLLKEMFGVTDATEQSETASVSEAALQAEEISDVSVTTPEAPASANEAILSVDVHVSAEPCPVSPMLVEMLLEEIKHIEEDIEETTIKITSASVSDKLRTDALLQLAVRFERFGNACQAAELAGLYQASEIIQKNLVLTAQDGGLVTADLAILIVSWPESVKAYLMSLGERDCSEKITNILSAAIWRKPLMAEVAPALIDLLNAPYPSTEETREARETEITAEDISLTLPTDISQELLKGLLQELPSQTEGFSNAIHALIDGSGGSKEIEQAQRIAHTVKGAANTVGIQGIATLTHQLEDIFQFLNQHNRLPSKALAASLVDAADCLEEMSESLIAQSDAPANAQTVLQDILNWINRLENEGVEILDDEVATATDKTSADDENKKADETEDEQAAIATLRVQAPIIDDLIRLIGETIILTTQLQEKIKDSTTETEALIKQNEASHELINHLEQQVELRGITNVQQAANQNEVFDSLELEQYNELHTVTNQLAETTLDSVELNKIIKRDLNELDELLIDQSRLHREVQGLVMRTRMVPIKSITPRLQRSVRQTCRAVGKQAALLLSGSETLIDSDILNNLVDPLIHMLRNALDHGIEDRDQRINKNKDPEGKIELSFASEGTQIVVRCKDDGAGLNHDAIRATAIKRGFIEPDAKLTPMELDRMILRPGFSTSKKTTQVSGRGIGMDLVYSQILASKGALHIESEKDKGCLIELRLPVTLISSHVLMIRHRNRMLAVSSRGVEQILHPSDSQIVESEHGLMCKVEDELLELSNLEDLIDFPGDRRLSDRETRPALLIREADVNKVVYIQEIVDSRELVIKSMGKYMNNIPGIPGATILGDGSIVPVLDIPDLLRTSIDRDPRPEHDNFQQTDITAALPTALVVDDSLSARRALAQVVRDAGYDVRTAKDGLEAIDIIDKKRPDILLVDMEMPRMNGMELTAHVRANSAISDIPVIMITSRSTAKHREQASAAGVNVHLTKPFSEDNLLDNISKLLS